MRSHLLEGKVRHRRAGPVEYALEIKARRPGSFVISLANGWVGYVPTVQAFSRPCGHETTSALWSKLVPEAGDTLADTALELVADEPQMDIIMVYENSGLLLDVYPREVTNAVNRVFLDFVH